MVICECYYRKRRDGRKVYKMFFMGRNFVSDLLCILKSKNLKNLQKTKNLKTFSKKLIFCSSGIRRVTGDTEFWSGRSYRRVIVSYFSSSGVRWRHYYFSACDWLRHYVNESRWYCTICPRSKSHDCYLWRNSESRFFSECG